MNATRAATIRGRAWVGGVVSLGRVQTPTLALMVKREREIQAFVPEPYWLVHAQFDPRYEGLWFEGDETRLKEAKRAEEIAAKVSGKDGVVESVERKEQSERAPLLYDLTSLQRDANRRFGFSARRTLQAAQSLYEDKKAITYPRTNSRWLSGDLVPQLKPTAATLAADRRVRRRPRATCSACSSCRSRASSTTRRSATTTRSSRPTSSTTSAASRPTSAASSTWSPAASWPSSTRRRATPARRSSRSSRRSASARAARSRSRPAGAASTGCSPRPTSRPRRQDEEGENESAELPPLEQGQTIKCAEAEVEAKETKPPPRYTEATLLSAMETAGKLIDDEELREAMKESGLGTPATRAETIETLIRREYIERGGKDLMPTPKGLQVITMLEEHPLTSPELTGSWEKRLTDIEHGEDDRAKFIGDIAEFTRATVEKIAELDKEKLRPERVELGLCPRCGAETGEIIRENSKAYGCTSWKSREETGLRLRHLEARRGPDAHPRARAPAARGGQDEGRHLRLSLTCRQTFSRASRLER